MILLWIFLWWLSGAIPFIIDYKQIMGYVKVSTIVMAFFVGLAGPLCLIIVISDADFWDKKIF